MSDATSQTAAGQTLAVPHDGGEARWWFGGLAVIRATADQTGGALSVIEVTEPPGAEAPWHVHHRDDEAFWILEGTVRFEVGEQEVAASAGDFLFAPRDIPHRYIVGDTGCRMLFILTPGGFDQMVMATSEPAASRNLPPPATEEPDWEHLAGIITAHGCEMLG
jgi:quercetin dioxygenase-like cupin family protein